MLPLNTNIREAYACGQDQEQNFIQNLAMFLCTYLKEHGTLVEKKQLNEVLMKVKLFLFTYLYCVVVFVIDGHQTSCTWLQECPFFRCV